MSDAEAMSAIAVICICSMFALVSLLLALLGFAQARNPQGGFSWGKRQRTEMLHQWIPTLRWAAPWLQIDLFNQTVRLMGWALCGAGVGMFVGVLGFCALLLALIALDPGYVFPVFIILTVPAVTLSSAIGAALGFRWSGRSATRGQPEPVSAAWEPRRVGDYRAGWLDWMLTLISLAIVAACAAIAYRFPELTFLTLPGVTTAPALPALALIAGVALLGSLVSRLAGHLIAAAPRAIASPFSGVANDAEDYIRAQMITLPFSFTWRSCGWLMWALAGLPFDYAVPSGLSLWLSYLCLLLGFIVMIVGSLSPLFKGRLGGRRVGWPWRPRQAGMQAPVWP